MAGGSPISSAVQAFAAAGGSVRSAATAAHPQRQFCSQDRAHIFCSPFVVGAHRERLLGAAVAHR